MQWAGIALISALMVLCCSDVLPAERHVVWERYQREFIQKDGRVIDFGQDNSSHSEGQGYAMNFAVMFDDSDTFEKLWEWTRNNIGIRKDGLFAWRWGRRSDNEWTVLDKNNATDGDILIAYALLKADEKWPGHGYKSAGTDVLRSMRKELGARWRRHHFLLPGKKGFRKGHGYILNPSYMIFPAIKYFAKVDKRAFWKRIYSDGHVLVEKSYTGRMHLPPDWVFLSDSNVEIYGNKKPLFSASAVRVLLHSALEHKPRLGKGAGNILDLFQKLGYFPSWINLQDGSYSSFPASAGYYAVYGLVAQKLKRTDLCRQIFFEAERKLAEEHGKYYSMSLYLIATSSGSYWN